MNEMLLFARTFLKEPKMLGSVIPSSRFLTNRLLRIMDLKRANLIVEFGPGIGNITDEILDELNSRGKLVAIEMNDIFARHLKDNSRAGRLIVAHDSAENVQTVLAMPAFASADSIFSRLPLST